jgi:hypothetical protein
MKTRLERRCGMIQVYFFGIATNWTINSTPNEFRGTLIMREGGAL